MNSLFDGWAKRALVLVSHLDDEALGMAGTIHYLSEACGFEVDVLVLSSKTTYNVPDIGRDVDLKDRAAAVARVLGVHQYYYLNFPDGRIGMDMPLLVGGVEKLFHAIKPSLVFSHCRYDTNQDHRAAYRVSEILCRQFRRKGDLRAVFSYEVQSATNFGVQEQFTPSVFFEIDIEKKLEALRCYSSELDSSPGSRNEEGVRALAMYRGTQCGSKFAEGFEVLKLVF